MFLALAHNLIFGHYISELLRTGAQTTITHGTFYNLFETKKT